MDDRKRGSDAARFDAADTAALRAAHSAIKQRLRGHGGAAPKAKSGLGAETWSRLDRISREQSGGRQARPMSHGSIGSFQEKSDNAIAALEPAVHKIRSEFIAKLTEYRRRLDFALDAETDDIERDAYVDDAVFVSHRIAGVARTFGFAELGEVARRTESNLAAYRDDQALVELEMVSARIAQLIKAIDKVCAEERERLG